MESYCPVDHSSSRESHKEKETSSCPVRHDSPHGINPLNMMPHLSQEQTEDQTIPLSTQRTTSSIPTTSGPSDKWVYPSPQQFYNALRRKGWKTPENEIDVMVDIHNFLNEGSWQEVLKWERAFHCDCIDIKLARFQGKPKEPSPKSRLLSFFGLASKPFDRHDWIIDRCGKEVRYIIDYYSEKNENDPVFYVDVRPALDSPGSFIDRTRRIFHEIWEDYGKK